MSATKIMVISDFGFSGSSAHSRAFTKRVAMVAERFLLS
jgi:hypothetical protein